MDVAEMNRLARAFRDGDTESFKLLVESLTRQLIAFAYRYTGEWESARDLCQDTWLRVYENISGYDPARPFRAWVYAIHRNGCISHARSAERRLVERDGEAMLEKEASAPGDGPERDIERTEFAGRLREAMTRLTGKQRLVFAMVDVEENTRADAARALCMNESTLRVTLHNARRRIAEILRRTE